MFNYFGKNRGTIEVSKELVKPQNGVFRKVSGKEEIAMDFERVNIKGGSAYEDVAGYSRIVKAGPFVYVSGTTSVTPEGTVYGEGDPYEQAKYIFNKLVGLLEENGVSREEVVKVNIFATKYSYNNEITRAYSEYFKESRPCCTWIGIKELNRPTQLVEIEMQAIVGAKA